MGSELNYPPTRHLVQLSASYCFGQERILSDNCLIEIPKETGLSANHSSWASPAWLDEAANQGMTAKRDEWAEAVVQNEPGPEARCRPKAQTLDNNARLEKRKCEPPKSGREFLADSGLAFEISGPASAAGAGPLH
jgi:hypothetical protein